MPSADEQSANGHGLHPLNTKWSKGNRSKFVYSDDPSRQSADDLAVLPSGGELPAGIALPEWIRIAPAGELRCRDARVYRLDPATLVRRFDADRVDIPIDLGHATISDTKAPALGWIDRMEARPDGLYGHVKEWLDGGRDVLKARTHRYISPAFYSDGQENATWLHSVALVAAPALAMSALLSAGGAGAPGEAGLVAELAATLGLRPGATREACMRRVASWANEAVPLSVHQHALTGLAAAKHELATLQADVRAKEVDALIEGGLKALKIAPPERDKYVALCSTDAGLKTVKELLAVAMPKIAPSVLDGRSVDGGVARPAVDQTDAAALAAAAQTLMHEREQKGLRPIGIADAMARVLQGER